MRSVFFFLVLCLLLLGLNEFVLAKEFKDVPLRFAFASMLPKGWQYTLPKDFENKRVSFDFSKKTWADDVEALARRCSLRARIVYSKKRIVLEQEEQEGSLRKSLLQRAKEGIEKERFLLHPGFLSVQLAQWCSRWHYDLMWKASFEYELIGSVEFSGTFEQAIQWLFATLKRQGYPLRATLYRSNKVVYVSSE